MFSVLLSLYHKEKPEYLEKCFESIWDNQSLKPSEI
ncbi:amylovoran biosynthesis protein AmsE, partial [Acinetobacter baumannii]